MGVDAKQIGALPTQPTEELHRADFRGADDGWSNSVGAAGSSSVTTGNRLAVTPSAPIVLPSPPVLIQNSGVAYDDLSTLGALIVECEVALDPTQPSTAGSEHYGGVYLSGLSGSNGEGIGVFLQSLENAGSGNLSLLYGNFSAGINSLDLGANLGDAGYTDLVRLRYHIQIAPGGDKFDASVYLNGKAVLTVNSVDLAATLLNTGVVPLLTCQSTVGVFSAEYDTVRIWSLPVDPAVGLYSVPPGWTSEIQDRSGVLWLVATDGTDTHEVELGSVAPPPTSLAGFQADFEDF